MDLPLEVIQKIGTTLDSKSYQNLRQSFRSSLPKTQRITASLFLQQRQSQDFQLEISTVTNTTFSMILQRFMDKELLLLSRFPQLFDSQLDPSISDNTFLVWAAFFGHSDVVKYLLLHPKVNPADIHNYAMRMAAFKGKAKIVELLLNDRRVDPCVQNHYPLRWAKENKHQEVVDILMNDPRVSSTYIPNV
jgi:hypothetical protein